MKNAGFADLPHELLDQILRYLPSARDIASLGLLNRAFHTYIEEEGWSVFTRSKFYWIDHSETRPWKSLARSLTTVSRAWDRRAFVIRDLEPKGDIVRHPVGTRLETWQAPVGQTMGFVPMLDVYEKHTNGRASIEVLAFSAGAQICIRSRLCKYKNFVKTSESVRWSIYRSPAAMEGREDVTSLKLLHSNSSRPTQQLIYGTADGELRLLSMPLNIGKSSIISDFDTQRLPVQSASLWQQDRERPVLAAALGSTHLALYNVDASQGKTTPADICDFKAPNSNHAAFKSSSCRIRTTQFLSKDQLALGIGSSEHPLIYQQIRPSGIDGACTRIFRLDDHSKTYRSNAVYAITPALDSEQIFFTGAYDGLVRMHDLRSPQDIAGYFTSPTSDAAVYSVLMRGTHTLLSGTSRDEVVHVFDLRYGSGKYRYTDAFKVQPGRQLDRKWSIFLSGGTTNSQRLNNGRRAGSVYSLAASSADSPKIYLGLEGTILESAATEVAHRHPDPWYFKPWPSHKKKKHHPHHWNGWTDTEVRHVSLYEGGSLFMQSDLMQAWTDDKRRDLPRQDGWPIDLRYLEIPKEQQRKR